MIPTSVEATDAPVVETRSPVARIDAAVVETDARVLDARTAEIPVAHSNGS